MFKILVSDKLGQAGLDKLDAAKDVEYDVKTGLSKDELVKIIGEYDALIVRSGTRPDAEILAAGTKLKVVGRAGMGVDNIDVIAATKHGIVVMNTPGANSVATAEQAMTLMLAASRHTAQSHESVKNGEWKRSSFVGQELKDKTLGVIGFGRIGRLVTERAQAFGMQVIAYDPFVSEAVGRELNITLVDLDDLLAQSDYITLHTALVPETNEMINAETIAQMKDGVIIINAARGKLINEAALAEGIKSGKVKAAALDVYTKEPPTDSPLIGLDGVIHTPHLGASTVESQRAVAEMVVDQVLDGLRGKGFRNAVNMPFQSGPEFDALRPYLLLAEKIGALQQHLSTGKLTQIEIGVLGTDVDGMVKPIAAGILKGVLESVLVNETVNYINAPILAEHEGITVAQMDDWETADYPNLISCKAHWKGGSRLISGVLFGHSEPRIVQVDNYRLEAKPEGYVLVMANKDVPGVIGQVGTLLSAYQVNIGEWRLGRFEPGSEALSFINLDSLPPTIALEAIGQITAVTQVKLMKL